MSVRKWNQLALPEEEGGQAWSLFHENSKTSRYDSMLSDEAIVARMREMKNSLPYVRCPAIPLPTTYSPLTSTLGEAILNRVTARAMEPVTLSLESVATLLHHAYGVTRNNADGRYPRPFRTVPSGGALYPLEIYLHSASIAGLKAGLYHYDPSQNNLRLLRAGDESTRLSEHLVQRNIVREAAMLIFITALFERSTFKYGNRGYRMVLLEAGHVGQNLSLVAGGLGLGCVSIAGYFDRGIDDFLDLNGVTHSTIYMFGIGRPLNEGQDRTGQR